MQLKDLTKWIGIYCVVRTNVIDNNLIINARDSKNAAVPTLIVKNIHKNPNVMRMFDETGIIGEIYISIRLNSDNNNQVVGLRTHKDNGDIILTLMDKYPADIIEMVNGTKHIVLIDDISDFCTYYLNDQNRINNTYSNRIDLCTGVPIQINDRYICSITPDVVYDTVSKTFEYISWNQSALNN